MAIALAIAAALAVGGCGLQTQGRTGMVSLTLTRGFGAQKLGSATVAHPPAGATALGLLRRRFTVTLGPGGSVHTIDGRPAVGDAGRWSLYVNGVAARGDTRVHTGDRLWWDFRAARAAPPAVVGSFPEPFLHGLGGKRLPTTVECAGDVRAACNRVTAALGRAGVPVASQALGAGSGQDSLAVVVGTWRDISGELAATLLARGPASSGVYARFSGGRNPSLELLSAGGTAVQTLIAKAGLIAALAQNGAPPTWLVIGTDAAGVTAAARAFSGSRLREHFALAVGGGRDLPLPR